MYNSILRFLKSRLPAGKDVFLALSMAVFIIFSWSLRSMFYTFPSFNLAHSFWELLTIFAYMMTFAMFDTVLVMFVMLLLAAVLPKGILRDGFSYKAAFFFLSTTIIFMHIQAVLTDQTNLRFLALQFGLILLLWLAPVLLTHFVRPVQVIVLDILDRLTIFPYIYLPIGILSFFVVAIRLIW